MKLFPFGSSFTNLALDGSDLDLIAFLPSLRNLKGRNNPAQRCLSNVLAILRQKNSLPSFKLSGFQLRGRAHVPVLVFKAKSLKGSQATISVDLNINCSDGLKNSHYILKIANSDIRFKYLVLFVKLWASKFAINDAKTQKLSSYTLMLMIVYYLQSNFLENIFEFCILNNFLIKVSVLHQ